MKALLKFNGNGELWRKLVMPIDFQYPFDNNCADNRKHNIEKNQCLLICSDMYIVFIFIYNTSEIILNGI